MEYQNNGSLYIVATPIGNLSDITLRALDTLKSVDIIACENISKHIKLLNHYSIKKKLIEYSPSNEINSAKGIIKLLKEGKNIALVSDAGTPCLSDPGSILVREAIKEDIKIIPIPGVSALSTIVSVAGIKGKDILFLGFLPKNKAKIRKIFKNLSSFENISIVYYDSQYNFKKNLSEIYNLLGNVDIIIGREMTKINEEFIRGKIEDILNKEFEEKGEFTILISKN